MRFELNKDVLRDCAFGALCNSLSSITLTSCRRTPRAQFPAAYAKVRSEMIYRQRSASASVVDLSREGNLLDKQKKVFLFPTPRNNNLPEFTLNNENAGKANLKKKWLRASTTRLGAVTRHASSRHDRTKFLVINLAEYPPSRQRPVPGSQRPCAGGSPRCPFLY
ncbi:hypothetical protein EVAR_44687_1 [Eumeta japonica]|uniref:Uncharacterized protein n=1 Tax=Eumeta variegata TaxID=151549 RepID=A0A4C1XIM8_EUMVA|nr:hypothetical protein EVAR_44687_1 [Eumeta japonica]